MKDNRDIFKELKALYKDQLTHRGDHWMFKGVVMHRTNLCRIIAGELNASNQRVNNALEQLAFELRKTNEQR